MSTLKTPPSFSSKRSYQRYRAELTAWTAVTSIKKESWARIIALSMPDSSEEGDIRGKLFDSLGDELAGEAGYQKLLDWLDKHFKQNEDIVMIDSIKQFMKFVKKPEMSITEFLAGFDTAYNTAIKKGLDKLPQPYLMYMIIENAGLTEQEVKFVLSDVDKTKKDTLYDQTRNAMKKYLIGLNGEDKDSSGIVHKPDTSVMYLNNKGRLIRPQAGSWRPKVPQYMPMNPIRSAQNQQLPYRGQNASGSYRYRVPVNVPKNPEKDGKTMLCDICGAYTHLQAKCPHNPNNRAYVTEKVEDINESIEAMQVVENIEQDGGIYYGVPEEFSRSHAQNIADVMGHSNEQQQYYAVFDTLTVTEIYSNSVEAITYHGLKHEIGTTVLDTGCVKTVAGQVWFDTFVDTLHPSTQKMISAQPSENIFKFGGGERRKSMGLFSIPCSVAGKNILLITDVVKQQDLPCLLSKESSEHEKGWRQD